MAHYTALLQEHKEAQSGLEYYGRLRSETECNYRHICILQQQNLTPGRLAELKRVKRTFSAFISADYIDHFIELHIDKWVRHLTLCIDNARICKNQYPVAWTMELVESKRFDTVRFVHLTVGHTKFAPDNLFASIAKTFYNSDVFCIKMLDHIIQQYATSLILHTQADEALEKKSLEQKYSTIPGITEMLDILVKLGKVYQRRVCFNGEYTDHIVTSDKQQKKKRQCAFPGCDRSGHVNPARKHHLSEKNCPLAAKKPRVPHCNVVLFWYLYLEVICV